jgi:phosphopantothenoylcysteine synthetase/decarboxylase
MKVLITAGGTEEPIDGVRRLTNLSTGATGAALARHFATRGAEVLLLHAARAAVGDQACERELFTTFAELEAALRRLLATRAFDVVVHAAAVGDWAIAAVELDGAARDHRARGKLEGGHDLVLRLRPNPKLIDSLRTWSANPALTVVGFKLTDEPDPEARPEKARALLARGAADLVVHNDLSEIAGSRHRATIHGPEGVLAVAGSKEELAEQLFAILEKGAAA